MLMSPRYEIGGSPKVVFFVMISYPYRITSIQSLDWHHFVKLSKQNCSVGIWEVKVLVVYKCFAGDDQAEPRAGSNMSSVRSCYTPTRNLHTTLTHPMTYLAPICLDF